MEKRVETSDGFTFVLKEDYGHGETWEVSYCPKEEQEAIRKGEDPRMRVLGNIQSYPSSNNWAIKSMGQGFHDHFNTKRYKAIFPTKESAAFAMYVIYKTVEANPLSEDVRIFLDTRARHLREERSKLDSKYFEVQREMAELQAIAKKNDIDFNFFVDVKQEVKDLNTFLDENMDALYEHMGKDFARSLRGNVRSIVKLIDPQTALDI